MTLILLSVSCRLCPEPRILGLCRVAAPSISKECCPPRLNPLPRARVRAVALNLSVTEQEVIQLRPRAQSGPGNLFQVIPLLAKLESRCPSGIILGRALFPI